MKIGLITGEYPPMQGGVGDFTRELSMALADLGHEVHVITRVGCGADEGRRTKDEKYDGGRKTEDESLAHHASRVTIHPIVPNWGWRSYSRVMGLAHRLNLDVLNIQYQAAAYDLHPAINFFPLLALRLPGWRASFPPALRGGLRGGLPCPATVVTFHDLKVPYLFPKAGSLRDWVVTLLARYADAAIVTNRVDELALTARCVGHHARRVGQIERIPIGSNIAPTLPPGYDRDVWRARFGIMPKDCLLGFFGFFNARKGIETLVRALAILRQDSGTNPEFPNPKFPNPESPHPEFPNYHLLFIGGTVGSSDATNRAYADRVAALMAELGLSDRVHYTGYVPAPEVSAAFAATDLCVLPYADGISFHHGTLMAALTHGRPIVSTHPPVELPELTHGENVWLVPPEDPGTLAAAITTLTADPESRQRLARGAAELSAEFTWERIAARTAGLFESVRRDE